MCIAFVMTQSMLSCCFEDSDKMPKGSFDIFLNELNYRLLQQTMTSSLYVCGECRKAANPTIFSVPLQFSPNLKTWGA